MDYTCSINSPIGTLILVADNSCITGISVSEDICHEDSNGSPVLIQAAREIEEYFAGTRKEFTFPVKMTGTPFQQQVWEELRKIPYGSTVSYRYIAERIGNPKASRAVGMACNCNPLLIAVPCHRVVGKDGKLTGFAVGIERKAFLLMLEGHINPLPCITFEPL